MHYHLQLDNPARESFRAAQVAGMFGIELEDAKGFKLRAEVPDLDEPWQIGAMVGPSGAGKTALARAAFAEHFPPPTDWPRDHAVVDGFPAQLSMREIAAGLAAVGLHSAPAWLRPFSVLSQGEQFRCQLAHALLSARTCSNERAPLVVCDEFTSKVDRETARSVACSLSKAIRGGHLAARLVAVTCHTDILPWLAPDWTLDLATGQLSRGSLRRPNVELEIVPVRRRAWDLFRAHHYLASGLNPAARSFAVFLADRPVAFSAWLRMGTAGNRSRDLCRAYREHRTVVLPEFQGLGIGNRVSAWCASLFRGLGHRVFSTSSHPAMIRHRLASAAWRKVRLGFTSPSRRPHESRNPGRNLAALRWTASFEYIGPAMDERAAKELMAG